MNCESESFKHTHRARIPLFYICTTFEDSTSRHSLGHVPSVAPNAAGGQLKVKSPPAQVLTCWLVLALQLGADSDPDIQSSSSTFSSHSQKQDQKKTHQQNGALLILDHCAMKQSVPRGMAFVPASLHMGQAEF